jgi:hypothetical protein
MPGTQRSPLLRRDGELDSHLASGLVGHLGVGEESRQTARAVRLSRTMS